MLNPETIFNIAVIVIFVLALLWVILRPIHPPFRSSEGFGGSDWSASFYGPIIWSGWNYGSGIDVVAPRPEET
jgi:hypothetical protein